MDMWQIDEDRTRTRQEIEKNADVLVWRTMELYNAYAYMKDLFSAVQDVIQTTVRELGYRMLPETVTDGEYHHIMGALNAAFCEMFDD